jgi:predicted nuclease of predicted toxin-antitoxin system
MWEFLIDEDMPRSTAVVLRQAGHSAEDVRDIGLRGRSDQEVFEYAQAQGTILLTADKGFSNIVRFPVGSHEGIMVVRVPNELPTQTVNDELLRALEDLEGEDLAGLLMIVEVGRTRVRRAGRLDPQS